MGDATNCTATRNLKAHVVQLHSVYHVGVGTHDKDAADTSTLWQHTVMPDLALSWQVTASACALLRTAPHAQSTFAGRTYAFFIFERLDPGSGWKLPAIRHGAGTYSGVFIPETLM